MMAWLPVFFLYFNQSLEIKEVILLESIYYMSVVLLEVPSGYFSDKIGRKITLIISSLGFAVGYLLFGLSQPDFVVFCVGQVALAIGMSFMSGTNTAFYFESLQAQGKENEFADREAKVVGATELASAVAVLLGGFIGALHLNYAYLLSFILVIPGVIISFLFVEPDQLESKTSKGILDQSKTVLHTLRQHELKWVFIFTVVLYIMTHIPYEFYQPYLKLLEMDHGLFSVDAAIYSGIIFAITRVMGSIAATNSIRLRDRYGLKMLCWTAIALQLFLIAMMGILLSIWVLPLILL